MVAVHIEGAAQILLVSLDSNYSILPIWVNFTMLVLSQYLGGSADRCCERGTNDGCSRLWYQLFILANIVISV